VIRFILKRLCILLLMLFVVSVATFLLPYMSGQEPAEAILRSRIPETTPNPQAVENIRDELGLDRPVPLQYLAWLKAALGGDLGLSYVSREPVSAMLGSALWISFTLAFVALGAALLLSVPLGIVAALKPGKWLDNAITGTTQTGVAIPEYWSGPLLILLFALTLGWLPSAGWGSPVYLVLPCAVLALRPISYLTRVMRASMIDVLGSQYLVAAEARGLSRNRAILRHGVKNAIIPVVTLVTLWLGAMLGGSVVVEIIFAIPGTGRMIYQAIVNSDLPVIQAGFMTILGLTVVINTVADVLHTVLNPSISLTRPRL
jgi:peptide/nickel transport system permease protein